MQREVSALDKNNRGELCGPALVVTTYLKKEMREQEALK